MKQNEKFLVYAVTGFLVVILGVAILFGNEQPRRLPEVPVAGVNGGTPPSLEDMLNRRAGAPAVPTPEAGDPAKSAPTGTEPAAGVGDGHGSEAPAGVVPPVQAPIAAPSDQPLVANVQLQPPSAAALVTEKLGLNRVERGFRIVRARAGDSLGALVQKWCGSTGDYLEQAKGLNEELTTLRVGQEIVLPLVEDETLLAALESRGVPATGRPTPTPAWSLLGGDAGPVRATPPATAHASLVPDFVTPTVTPTVAPAAAAGQRKYKIKAGEALWKIAEREVGRKQAPAFLGKVRELNPGLDTDRVREGQEIVLPPKAQ